MKKLIAILALTSIPLQLFAQDAFLIIPFGGDFNQPADALNEPGVSLPATSAGNPLYIRVAPGRYEVKQPAQIKALSDHTGNDRRTAVIQGDAASTRGVQVEIIERANPATGLDARLSPVSEAARVFTERDGEEGPLEAAVRQAIAEDPRVRSRLVTADGAVLHNRPDDNVTTYVMVANRENKEFSDEQSNCFEAADLTMNITDAACLLPGQSPW